MTRQEDERSDQDVPAPAPRAGEETLTAAQRAFARLLGRLLAEKWRNENRAGAGGQAEPRPDEETGST